MERRPTSYPGVAQLVARVVWDHQAAGSNPVTRTSVEMPLKMPWPCSQGHAHRSGAFLLLPKMQACLLGTLFKALKMSGPRKRIPSIGQSHSSFSHRKRFAGLRWEPCFNMVAARGPEISSQAGLFCGNPFTAEYLSAAERHPQNRLTPYVTPCYTVKEVVIGVEVG